MKYSLSCFHSTNIIIRNKDLEIELIPVCVCTDHKHSLFWRISMRFNNKINSRCVEINVCFQNCNVRFFESSSLLKMIKCSPLFLKVPLKELLFLLWGWRESPVRRRSLLPLNHKLHHRYSVLRFKAMLTRRYYLILVRMTITKKTKKKKRERPKR